MDPVHTLLDRELLLSGVAHELRGQIQNVQFCLELDEEHAPRPTLHSAVARLNGLVDTLSETAVAPPEPAVFCGTAVRCKGPPEVLERALAMLPHRSVTAEIQPDQVVVSIRGVPAGEQAAGWSLGQVQAWLAEGGPGLAGARLRIAARIVGALRYFFSVREGEAEGVVYIHLARG